MKSWVTLAFIIVVATLLVVGGCRRETTPTTVSQTATESQATNEIDSEIDSILVEESDDVEVGSLI